MRPILNRLPYRNFDAESPMRKLRDLPLVKAISLLPCISIVTILSASASPEIQLEKDPIPVSKTYSAHGMYVFNRATYISLRDNQTNGRFWIKENQTIGSVEAIEYMDANQSLVIRHEEKKYLVPIVSSSEQPVHVISNEIGLVSDDQIYASTVNSEDKTLAPNRMEIQLRRNKKWGKINSQKATIQGDDRLQISLNQINTKISQTTGDDTQPREIHTPQFNEPGKQAPIRKVNFISGTSETNR